MKIPLFTQPPPTPIKSITYKNDNLKLIAEGSFYKIYKTVKDSVLRISKRKIGELGMNEVEILKKIRKHPFINKMKKWWTEGGLMYFEMEECDCNLNEVMTEMHFNSAPISSSNNNSSDNIVNNNNSNNNNNNSSNNNTHIIINNSSPAGSFISDPFSDSIAPCSTSIIITDDSSEIDQSSVLLSDLPIPVWINLLMYQISSALSFVHSKGIIHMDIKPENILIKDKKKLQNRIKKESTRVKKIKTNGKYLNNDNGGPPNTRLNIHEGTPTLSIDEAGHSPITHLNIHEAGHSPITHLNIHEAGHSPITHLNIDDDGPPVLSSMMHKMFKLCDFNISKIGEGCFNLDGDKIYMAPEILKNKCYFKSDVYSLGLIYLELINCRSLPREGEEYLKLRRNDFEGWKIDDIGRRMLEKNPTKRCSSKEVEVYFRTRLLR